MKAQGEYPVSAMGLALRTAYRDGQDDETMEPFVLHEDGQPVGRIKRGDAVIFYNIRGEREIELTKCLAEANFGQFPRAGDLALHFATMIEYEEGLPVHVAFPSEGTITDNLCEVLSRYNLRQAKITEAEKAVHVTFFLNGKRSEPLPGEERIIVPTRKDVSLFDEAPEMSIEAIAQETIRKIHDPCCNIIFTNFPNVDVVGHIENERAVIRAVEAVDRYMGIVIDEARKAKITAIVTADHGTAEKWLYPNGEIDTGHTVSPVPFILINDDDKSPLREGGELTDIAPTILALLCLPQPSSMTGHPLNNAEHAQGCSPTGRLLLLILDGWGENPDSYGNLIARARTPTMDHLRRTYPSTILGASGDAVGLPPGTVGNSEAGHLHISAGRKVYADRVKIDRSIEDGSFFCNEAFLRVVRAARSTRSSLHLLGIVSFFSSHGSLTHLFALMDLAKREGVENLFIHAMLGRRGEMPESGANYIEKIEEKAREIQLGRVVSVIGRYWSMDREENWGRIEKTYRMLVRGQGIAVTA